mmetsp:Transcript_6868/g.14834  ORF Transcript_6868/g.14834 Transcript_6868/m.14834 type:complete len:233 (+) Transcript_6868:27-725(+)
MNMALRFNQSIAREHFSLIFRKFTFFGSGQTASIKSSNCQCTILWRMSLYPYANHMASSLLRCRKHHTTIFGPQQSANSFRSRRRNEFSIQAITIPSKSPSLMNKNTSRLASTPSFDTTLLSQWNITGQFHSGIKPRGEDVMCSFLENHGIEFFKKNQRIGDKREYFRPNAIIKYENCYVVIEYDENFHNAYSTKREVERMYKIRDHLKGNEEEEKEVVFLRLGTNGNKQSN